MGGGDTNALRSAGVISVQMKCMRRDSVCIELFRAPGVVGADELGFLGSSWLKTRDI